MGRDPRPQRQSHLLAVEPPRDRAARERASAAVGGGGQRPRREADLRRASGGPGAPHQDRRRAADTRMNCYPQYGSAPRRASRAVAVGPVVIGGAAPVVVQSMTNTDTADVAKTVRQVAELARAGSELVRVTVNNVEAAAAVPHIREQLDAMGVEVPLVGDFHFNGHRLLTQHPACAEALAKLRINPVNVGRGAKRDDQFATLIEFACRYDKPVRIGVNWGSLDQELLARMMDENAAAREPQDATVVT